MRKRTIAVTGVVAAVVATAVAVPAIAASRDEPAPSQARASVVGQQYAVDTGALKGALDARIDDAVASGWITPKLAAVLKERVAAGEKLVGRHLRTAEQQLLARAAKALGTTPRELRSELRAGKTPAQILKAHGKTPEALLQQLVDRIDTQLGQAVGKSRLSDQRADSILERLEQRLGAWLARVLGS